MTNEKLPDDDSILVFCKNKLLKGHYYDLTNRTLWNQLYNTLKVDFPTLYKWEGKRDWLYLKIINESDISNLLEMREGLLSSISEIDFVLLQLIGEVNLSND